MILNCVFNSLLFCTLLRKTKLYKKSLLLTSTAYLTKQYTSNNISKQIYILTKDILNEELQLYQ